jgi:Tol biopolymer transport system component
MNRSIGGGSVVSLLLAFARPAAAQHLELVDVGEDGSPGKGLACGALSVSDDGNRIAFMSASPGLVATDTDNLRDIFVRDRALATTVMVSISSAGISADKDCNSSRISADGAFVVFSSDSGLLVSGDNNKRLDVFVHELATGVTTRVSVNASGVEGNDDSFDPSISEDGRYVAFTSLASNLVSGDSNFVSDVFVVDRKTGTVERASLSSGGKELNGPSDQGEISRDGRHVVFTTYATNVDAADPDSLQDVYQRDLDAGTTMLVSVNSAGQKNDETAFRGAISDDGQLVAFVSTSSIFVPGDAFSTLDVFVRDLVAGTTTTVCLDNDGNFRTGNGGPVDSNAPWLSGDGSFVVFSTRAEDLLLGDANGSEDVVARAPALGMNTLQSVADDGTQADRFCNLPTCSRDGRFIAFYSQTMTLIPGLPPGEHLYLRERNLTSAAWANYGVGWPGTHGIPSLAPSATPALNAAIDLAFDDSWGRWSVALVFLGAQATDLPTGWGGHLLVDPLATVFLALPPGGGTLPGRVPPDEALAGAHVFAQVLEIDPGASDGVSFTPGLDLTLGF